MKSRGGLSPLSLDPGLIAAKHCTVELSLYFVVRRTHCDWASSCSVCSIGMGRITKVSYRPVVSVMWSASLAHTLHEAGQSGVIMQGTSSFTLLRGHFTASIVYPIITFHSSEKGTARIPSKTTQQLLFLPSTRSKRKCRGVAVWVEDNPWAN